MKSRFTHLQLLLCCAAAFSGSAAFGETEGRDKGEFGSDLGFLRSFYTPAAAPDGNHYIEMWKPGPGVKEVTQVCGLTNNRALFVSSHGDAVPTSRGVHYGFRPHQSRVPDRETAPSYSARDLFTLVGPHAATNIHNICISGCNIDGLLKPTELRQFFPNATNVTHIAAGESGFEPMFLQALTLPPGDIRPLFEMAQKTRTGAMAYSLGHTAAPHAVRLPPYIAELFLPGARQPFKIRIAGRDLLDPTADRALKLPE
ncbi:MAG: hypothetical protein QOF48_2830 [Verrucomicrobiota bacterium]|jgi:hypothetical protein